MCKTKANDELGLESPPVSTNIDIDKPEIELSRESVWAGLYEGSKSFTFDISATDYGDPPDFAVASIEIQWKEDEDGTWQGWDIEILPGTSPWFGDNDDPVEPVEGTMYFFQARATDNAGHISDWSDDINVTPDYTEPTCAITDLIVQEAIVLIALVISIFAVGLSAKSVRASVDSIIWPSMRWGNICFSFEVGRSGRYFRN